MPTGLELLVHDLITDSSKFYGELTSYNGNKRFTAYFSLLSPRTRTYLRIRGALFDLDDELKIRC